MMSGGFRPMLLLLAVCLSFLAPPASSGCVKFLAHEDDGPLEINGSPTTFLTNINAEIKINVERITSVKPTMNDEDFAKLNIFWRDHVLYSEEISPQNWTLNFTNQEFNRNFLKLGVKIKIPSSGKDELRFVLENSASCNLSSSQVTYYATIRAIPAWLSIIPPFITLVLSVTVRNVLVSMFSGILFGAICLNDFNPITGLVRTLDHIIPDAIAERNHAIVILFCWLLSGMVAIISKSGGTAGLGKEVLRRVNSSFSGQLCTWLLGLTVFFDDYANALIVGNTVRSITDKFRVSREKLAFLVDATSAPIASLAPVSSWVGFEISLLADQFKLIGLNKSSYLAFLRTIPMRFYSIFLIAFCFSNIMTRRDFGPMLVAERKARKMEDENDLEDSKPKVAAMNEGADNPLFIAKEGVPHRWYNAVVPIVFVILFTFVGILLDGYYAMKNKGSEDRTFANLFIHANSFNVLMWSGFFAFILPLTMYWLQGILTPKETTKYWIEGMKELMEPLIVLVLAWSLGSVVNNLRLSAWLVSGLGGGVNLSYLSSIIFLLSGFIAFCTGSSWSTMTILIPIVVPLAWELGASLNDDDRYEVLLQNVASVLAGSVFGDHCSPISDTTLLVALATKCEIPAHVKTQIPYAFVVAVLSIVVGTLPMGVFPNYHEWVAIPLGSLCVVLIHFFVGKRVEDYVVPAGDEKDLLSSVSNLAMTPERTE